MYFGSEFVILCFSKYIILKKRGNQRLASLKLNVENEHAFLNLLALMTLCNQRKKMNLKDNVVIYSHRENNDAFKIHQLYGHTFNRAILLCFRKEMSIINELHKTSTNLGDKISKKLPSIL